MARTADSSRILTAAFAAVTAVAYGQSAAPEDQPPKITVEQATSRSSPDLAPAYEGRRVQIEAQVASKPVWGVDTYFLAIRDDSRFGIVLEAMEDRFEKLSVGDFIRVEGSIRRRNGMPVLVPESIEPMGRKASVAAIELKPGELDTFRYTGLTVTTEGRVVATGTTSSGEVLTISDSRGSVDVFLPKQRRDDDPSLDRIKVGDRIRANGIVIQDCPLPPYDRYFQVLVAGQDAIAITDSSNGIPAYLLLTALTMIALLFIVWWFRENRLAGFRRTMQTLNSLGEDVLASTSLSEILKKIETVVPSITNASGVHIYLYNRKSRWLEPARSTRGPVLPNINLDEPGTPMNAGVAMCFRNRTLLNIPDTRRSPFFKADSRGEVPRSVMFVPMFAQNELLGVMQVHRTKTVRYFSSEEQAAAQHLANQLATSLKLQEQRSMREQLFKSEKLAATGQLISEVANELKEPVETMLVLSQISLRRRGQVDERDLQLLASESQRTAEIVARLISFGRNHEDSTAKPVEINGLISGLFHFREREWKTLGLKLQDRLGTEQMYVIGAQGQLEQVFLNLLVHAEQTLAETEDKTLAVSASLMGRRVLIDMSYSARITAPDPFSDAQNGGVALGLGVARGIIQSHGGDLRFERPSSNICRFNVELPRADTGANPAAHHNGRAMTAKLTMLLVEQDAASQRQAVAAFGSRGHRVVPVKSPEEAQDLVQRVRFDVVVCSSRLHGLNWITLYQQVQSHVDAFVLLTEAFDASLAQAFSNGNGYFLMKPLQDADLDRVLESIAAHATDSAVTR
jgi:GAF domain-containing protein/ActR/RegA family two-component response regulator